jgi:hypothetical protein
MRSHFFLCAELQSLTLMARPESSFHPSSFILHPFEKNAAGAVGLSRFMDLEPHS